MSLGTAPGVAGPGALGALAGLGALGGLGGLASRAAAHGDGAGLDLVYFWAAVLIALTPVLIFGAIGVWVLRKSWKERHEPGAPH